LYPKRFLGAISLARGIKSEHTASAASETSLTALADFCSPSDDVPHVLPLETDFAFYDVRYVSYTT